MNIDHPTLGELTLTKAAEGVYLDQDLRYHPFPGADPFYVNPPGPSYGQAKTGDLYRVAIAFGLKNASKPFARNVFHYVLKGITGSPGFATVATELLKQLFLALSAGTNSNAIISLYGSTYNFRNPVVDSLVESTDSLSGGNTADGNNSGATDLVPLRTAIVSHKGTAKRGRSFNGRTFWPAPDEDTQAAGTFTQDNLKFVQGTVDAMRELDLTAINANAEAAQSVFSAKQSKSTGSNVATPITSNTARPVFGSQRRRQDVT